MSSAKEGSTAFPKPLSPQGTGDVAALRCSEPLRSKVGGASKPSPYFAEWDRLGTACFWLHCAWGQLASFPRHILRNGTALGQLASFPRHVLRDGTAWGQLASSFIAPGDSSLLTSLRLGTACFFPSPCFAGWDRLGNFKG